MKAAAPPGMQVVQQQIEVELADVKKIQKEVTKLYSVRQSFLEKKNENEMVIKEFNLIDEHAVIYKLVGPVLAKQELVEARQNVEKRLEYMNSELKRIEKLMKDFEKQMEEKRKKIMGIQMKYKEDIAKMQQQQLQSKNI